MNHAIQCVVFGICGFIGGIVIGGLAANRRFHSKYEFVDEENDENNENEVISQPSDDFYNSDAPEKEVVMSKFDNIAKKNGYSGSKNRDNEPFYKAKVSGSYLIEEKDYDFGSDSYSKSEITYYKKDDIFADERDEMLDDPVFVLGEEAVKLAKESDLKMIWARNDDVYSAFEVSIVDGSYREIVLGEDFNEDESK